MWIDKNGKLNQVPREQKQIAEAKGVNTLYHSLLSS
jgi:hypothetical protein